MSNTAHPSPAPDDQALAPNADPEPDPALPELSTTGPHQSPDKLSPELNTTGPHQHEE